MAEPALRQKRAEPFGQRASAHVHVHAHTLASQGGLRSLLRTTGNMGPVGASTLAAAFGRGAMPLLCLPCNTGHACAAHAMLMQPERPATLPRRSKSCC